MLLLKQISKKYLGKHHSVNALNDINICLPDTGLIFISGRSGSGKSSLLNIIGGIDTPTDGSIVLDNQDFKQYNEKDYNYYRNTCIGFIFQNYNLISNFTVKQNIEIAFKLQNKAVNKDDIEHILEKVGLSGLSNRKANHLSGGQMQRVAIARALIKQPKIILADEPTGNLDSETSKQIIELFKELSNTILVIVVSHEKDFAKSYADRMIELSDGKIIKDETYNETTKTFNKTYKALKAKLPIGYAFRLGLRGFKTKVFKMILTIVLSLISLLFFATSSMFGRINEKQIWVDNVSRAKLDYALIENPKSNYDAFKYNEINDINHEYKHLSPMIVMEIRYGTDAVYDDTGDTLYYFSRDVDVYIELTNHNKDFYLNKLTENSRLPNSKDEVVISSYYAESFVEYGYRNQFGDRITITNVEDMIGKTIDYTNYGLGIYTIVGISVHDTSIYHILKTPVNEIKAETASEFHYIGNIARDFYQMNKHYLNYMLVYEGWYKEEGYDYYEDFKLYINLPNDKNELYDLKFSLDEDKIKLVTPLDETIEDLIIQTNNTKQVFLVLSIIFGVFAFLQLYNFIKLSVRSDIKEIGILRSIGARGFDICKIYLCQSGIFALVISLLSILIGFLGEYAGNRLINIHPYYLMGRIFEYKVIQFNLDVALKMLALSILSIFIATIIPVIRASLLKPIDALKQK